MRIENNNNVGFRAYFKNNNLLKKVYHQSNNGVNKNLLDTFVNKCPNHEVEIIDINSVVKSTMITLFNNTNNRSMTVFSGFACDRMNKILQDITKNADFWGQTDTKYQALISKNNK